MAERPIDDEFDHLDEEFDDQLRQWLSPAGRPSAGFGEPDRVLSDLRPRMSRARTVRRAQVALAGAAPLVLVLGGLAMLTGLSPAQRQSTVAGQPDETAVAVADEDRTTLEVTGTTSGHGAPVDQDQSGEPAAGVGDAAYASDQTSDGEPGPAPTNDEDPPAPPASPTTLAPDGSTTTSRSDSTGPASSATSGGGTTITSTTNPTTSLPGSEIIESDCGSIVVVVTGSSVDLVESLPDPGYQVEEKSNGPSEIEVSFEGSRGQCELHAKVENGRLVVSGDESEESDESDEH